MGMSDPCDDTKYIVTLTLAKVGSPSHEEAQSAVGHLQGCTGCRREFDPEARAQFASSVALGRKEDLGGNLEASLGTGSKASKRVPAPYPMPKPHDTDVLEAS